MTDTPLWAHLIPVVAVFAFFLLTTALLIWAERRVVARMQSRIGPNRVGPFGILQTLVDGVKMFFKEDVTPSMVDKPVYNLAPIIGVVAGFMAVAVIPIGGTFTIAGNEITLQVADLEVGMLWFLAWSSLHVYSNFLAGWASRSPYPLLGGVRSSAQMISYEIAQGLAIASVFIYAGSLRVSDIVAAQAGDGLVAGMPGWFAIPLFPAFVIFLVGMVAEAGRPPFDLAEAEGELVAGFMTEYSGLRFGMFMLAEFMSVVVMSAAMVTLFFGGPSGPTFGLPDAIAWVMPILWFVLKTAVFILLFVLLRASLPRYRYDKLMDLGWKVLIPVGLVWVLMTAGYVLLIEQGGLTATTRIVLAGLAGLIALALIVVPTSAADQSTPDLAVPDTDDEDTDDEARRGPVGSRRSS
jgi:NADH-quinone oxidoreductase subunit H